MKGGLSGGGGYVLPAKRRWRGLVIAVLALVFLSMLVPLVFLLGLHNGFHSPGFASERSNEVSGDRSRQVDEFMKRLAPTLLQDKALKDNNGTSVKTAKQVMPEKELQLVSGVPSPSSTLLKPSPSSNNTRAVHIDAESGKSCELKYGSYCLWLEEHKEEMKDAMVKKLKDQLFVARAYYPTIAKLPAQDKLSREMKQNIQDLERVLSDATTDLDLPQEIEKKLRRMEAAIDRAKSFPVDCNNIDKKLRQIVDMTEDEADFHMKQSAFLFQLAVQTMPKSLHCLSMRLTLEYFTSPTVGSEVLLTGKNLNPELHHYVIFSNNVLASSVVINSTVMHSKENWNQVFHVLTNVQNYFAMKVWFSRNTYKEATVNVLNIEDLNINYHDNLTLSLPEEFRISFHGVHDLPKSNISTEYLSVFSHSHYLLPEIFQNLKKVVVLDDDVVVQRDLSALWDLDMDGRVNGAIRFCSVNLNQLKSFLGRNSFNKNPCAWMSGLNVIDLVSWKKHNVTNTYRKLVRELSIQEESSGAASLRASLLTFEGLVYALDSTWALSGLGHDYNLDAVAIKRAAVLHFNGNMKPWLELGIPKYKVYWKEFLNREDQFLSQCNINS